MNTVIPERKHADSGGTCCGWQKLHPAAKGRGRSPAERELAGDRGNLWWVPMESSATEAKRPHARRHGILRRMGELRGVVRSGRTTLVSVMQAANFWERYNLSLFRPLHGSELWGILTQAQVSSAPVIVCEIGCK